jgi:hypothetical protein
MKLSKITKIDFLEQHLIFFGYIWVKLLISFYFFCWKLK